MHRRPQKPDGNAALRKVQHQERKRDAGQPVASIRGGLPDEEQPKVAGPQGRECAAERGGDAIPYSRGSLAFSRA